MYKKIIKKKIMKRSASFVQLVARLFALGQLVLSALKKCWNRSHKQQTANSLTCCIRVLFRYYITSSCHFIILQFVSSSLFLSLTLIFFIIVAFGSLCFPFNAKFMFIYIIFECEKKQSSQMRQQVKERIKLGFFLHLRRSHLVRTFILIGKSLDVNVSIKQQIEIDLEIENAIPSSNYAIASFT